MPASRSLLAPDLRIRETVPEVVGPQLRVRLLPAVAEKFTGIVKALSAARARKA